jgi:hypothetical protein
MSKEEKESDIIIIKPYNNEKTLVIDNKDSKDTKMKYPDNSYIISDDIDKDISVYGLFSSSEFSNLPDNSFSNITFMTTNNIKETETFVSNLLRLLKEDGIITVNGVSIIKKVKNKLYMLNTNNECTVEYAINKHDIFDKTSKPINKISVRMSPIPTMEETVFLIKNTQLP